jgi:hypothetical protein
MGSIPSPMTSVQNLIYYFNIILPSGPGSHICFLPFGISGGSSACFLFLPRLLVTWSFICFITDFSIHFVCLLASKSLT